MRQVTRLDYIREDDYQAVRLPYAGYAVEMWVILPGEGKFKAIQEQLGAGLLEKVQQNAQGWRVTLTLPRFNIETGLQLPKLLKELGMPEIFCPAMDFGGMVEGGGLCVDSALHRATIKVDEEGTEAAAATMVAIPVSEVEEVVMTVDHPFIFIIIERETGIILFFGQVLDPAED